MNSIVGQHAETPKAFAAQTLSEGVDVASSVILQYPKTGCMGMLTSSTEVQTDSIFCRIEATEGFITVEGVAASAPSSFTVYSKNAGSAGDGVSGENVKPIGEVYRFQNERGRGFFWEADAVALDIAAGKTENAIMPRAETLRVVDMLDGIRRQGGSRIPQDEQ